MKILYLPCHSILEMEEYKLFTELGHEVFSLGSYINPQTPHDPKRPPIDAPVNEYLLNVALQSSKENLHPKLIEWADVIIVQHVPEWILNNWSKFEGKTVVWRTIGQSIPDIETRLSVARAMGLKIVRYSPEEAKIQGYIGEDAMIRFYKDPEEFKGYTGEKESVITVCQSMKERSYHCNYDAFKEATEGLERHLYGTPSRNKDLTEMEDPIYSGQLDYEGLKEAYRVNRAYFYTGTYPASYTLNFIEAMMTGIPIVAIGREIADKKFYQMDSYEVDKIIESGFNGFVSNSISELKRNIEFLLRYPEEAKNIGQRGRDTAINLFGKETIKMRWKMFFDTL